jgi:TetR/AcrR family transcriptional repressor of bet genes
MGETREDFEGRTRLADKVCDLIADQGLTAVSVRAVAAAAGVSIGAVQHYFPTKEAMLIAAHERANARISARADAAAATAETPKEIIRAVLLSVLPLDEDSRRVVTVFTVFETAALHSEKLADRARQSSGELYTGFTELFRLAGAPDPAREAIAAVALLGLIQPMLLRDPHCTPKDALAVIDAHLDRVLPAKVPVT